MGKTAVYFGYDLNTVLFGITWNSESLLLGFHLGPFMVAFEFNHKEEEGDEE